MTEIRMRFQSLFSTLFLASTFIGCGAAQTNADDVTNGARAYYPTPTDLQGAPMQLGSKYTGKCAYHYKTGSASNSCTVELQVSQDMYELSMVVHATIDGQVHDVTTGNFRVDGNRIEDNRGLNIGSIGQIALNMTSATFGTLSLKFLNDGSVGLLVSDFSDLQGDHSKGPAFAAKLKLPNQN